jgi:hypothetical protein
MPPGHFGTDGKMRSTYLPECKCNTRRVVLIDGVLRCADCMAAYGEAGSFNYTDRYLADLISSAPHTFPVEKLKDATTGIEIQTGVDITVTRRLTDNNRFHAQVKDHPELWVAGSDPRNVIGNLVLTHKEKFGIREVTWPEDCTVKRL